MTNLVTHLRELVALGETIDEPNFPEITLGKAADEIERLTNRTCACIPMAPRPWKYCQDCGGLIRPVEPVKP